MAIKSTRLDTTETTVYTSSGNSAITVIYFCNTATGPLSINVHAVPAGYTASADNLMYYSVQIAPTDTFVIDTERLVLDASDSIVALVSAGTVGPTDPSVIATVSYMDI
jgi:hypothetical protein